MKQMFMDAQLPGASETAASFEFLNEDHTLGNALRYIIMKKYHHPPRHDEQPRR